MTCQPFSAYFAQQLKEVSIHQHYLGVTGKSNRDHIPCGATLNLQRLPSRYCSRLQNVLSWCMLSKTCKQTMIGRRKPSYNFIAGVLSKRDTLVEFLNDVGSALLKGRKHRELSATSQSIYLRSTSVSMPCHTMTHLHSMQPYLPIIVT